MRFVRLVATLPILISLSGFAQAHYRTVDEGTHHRTFALVEGSSVSLNGSWDEDSPLEVYAHAHPGHYIVFWQNGVLHRLDDPARIAELEQARAPMVPLEARQKELAAQQKPFAEKQRALAEQQHAAQGNPAEQGRIGRLQGEIGEQQGKIGVQQGEVGRQQGEVGRAFYNKVLSAIDTCLADNTCPAIPTATVQR